MKHPIFHVGEECYLRDSATIPHLSGRQWERSDWGMIRHIWRPRSISR